MKVLLVIETPKKPILYLQLLQPLGVLYIASFLESKGIETDVKDYCFEKRNHLEFKNYELIGYSMHSGNVVNTLASIEYARKCNPKAQIIVGGTHAKIIANKLIENPNIDCVIVDEAEDIFYNYLVANDKKTVKGMWVREKGKPYYTGKAESIENLDNVPFPAIDKVPYKKYNTVIKKRFPVCTMITSRGCPYNCIFCYHSLSYKYRARSPENVISEIKWLKYDLGVNEIWVADDNFSYDMERAEKICDLIIENKIDISLSFGNGLRADRLNERFLKKLKYAGCWFLTIAPEVGNENSLKRVRKDFTLDQVEKVVRVCKKIGIRTMSNFIIGFPWEGEKEIKDTITFAKKLDSDVLNINRLIPYPYTPIWKMVHRGEYGLNDEKANFEDTRFKHPTLTEKQIHNFIKEANHTFYTPKKLLNIAMMLNPLDVLQLVRYSLGTGIM